MKFPSGYPTEIKEKELKEIINKLTENVVSSTGGGGLVKDSGSMAQLRLGKLQLGLNELQSRQSKRVLLFTVMTAIFSLIISGTALFLSIQGNINSNSLESKKIDRQDELILELKQVNNQLVKIEENIDSIRMCRIIENNK